MKGHKMNNSNPMELDGNGYPTEETLETIRTWTHLEKFDDLLESINHLVSNYGKCEKAGDTWTFVTGGWSGNEDVIISLKENYTFWGMCWQSSERGGLHTFKCRT